MLCLAQYAPNELIRTNMPLKFNLEKAGLMFAVVMKFSYKHQATGLGSGANLPAFLVPP